MNSLTEQARLAALARYRIVDTDAEAMYDDIALLAAEICEVPIALISLVERDRQWFKSVVGLAVQETPRALSFCDHAIDTDGLLQIPNAAADERFRDNPLVIGDPGIRFYAGAPLRTPDNYILGTLCVIDRVPRELSPSKLRALEALARQVMLQLELRLTAIEAERTSSALRQAEKLAAVGRLASSISHEINNPLQSVTNLLYMADQDLPEAAHQLLVHAQAELARVSQTVTQSLRFHQQSEQPARVHLASLVQSVAKQYRDRMDSLGIEFTLRDRSTAPIYCFANDLRQVIANLFTNAFDAMRSGGRIVIHLSDHDDSVFLTFADTGTGMSTDVSERIFDAFFTTKGIMGNGLGLWVARDILRKHDARVTVRSSERANTHGTIFRLAFPQQATALLNSQP